MDPVKVLRLAQAMGDLPEQILVVGCEPAVLDPDEGGHMGLSLPVEAALHEAMQLVESLVRKIYNEGAADELD
jgi:hydrogenase maturation protease